MECFVYFGYPTTLGSNNKTQFTSDELIEFFK